MSWLGDFLGGITGKSQQDATAKAANKSNKQAEKYSAESKGALDSANADLMALLPLIAGMGASSQAGVEDLIRRVFGEMQMGNSRINSQYENAISGAGADTQASKAAIEQDFQDSLRTGSAAVKRSYTGTGMGNSSLVPSRVATSIVPNAIGSKMRALATLESSLADRTTGLRRERAGTLASRENLGTQFLTDALGKKIDLSQQYFGQEMGVRTAPIQNRLNSLVQPGVIYPNLNFPATISGASAAGSTLGGIGAGALGAFSNNYFGGLGTNAAGNSSIQALIAALSGRQS